MKQETQELTRSLVHSFASFPLVSSISEKGNRSKVPKASSLPTSASQAVSHSPTQQPSAQESRSGRQWLPLVSTHTYPWLCRVPVKCHHVPWITWALVPGKVGILPTAGDPLIWVPQQKVLTCTVFTLLQLEILTAKTRVSSLTTTVRHGRGNLCHSNKAKKKVLKGFHWKRSQVVTTHKWHNSILTKA